MPIQPTGVPPYSADATTRERTVNDELYRAGQHAEGEREATAIRAGLGLILELIATRHRRQTNGFFDDSGAAN